jgi:hypothetical protein
VVSRNPHLPWPRLVAGYLSGLRNMIGLPEQRIPMRTLAAGLALCSMATFALLLSHPGGGARTFTELLQAEARDQLTAAMVHGGFMVTLGALLVCFVFLCRYLGAGRIPVVLGFVAFCVGSGVLMASMLVDGFVTPAIAVRFSGLTAPADVASAQTLIVMCSTLIRFLMPTGIIFQGIAMLGFSWTLLGRGGLARAAGIYGLVAGVILCGALPVVPLRMSAHALLIAILLQAAWYFMLSLVVFGTRRVPELSHFH